ncbi:MAG: hypothetical protein HC910_08455 [Spirulinaceae cyanobacterium SM2_1_0]|nr:hypothetical protein [Spirulinaceae cyanobacterium SM2_1_0]
MSEFEPEQTDRRVKLVHSRLGMVSLGLAIAAALSFLGCFVLMAVVVANNPTLAESNLEADELTTSMVIAVLLVLLAMICALFGFIFGLISIFIKQRRKLFPMLGTALNTTMLVLIFGLGLLGLLLQN